jgi:hypothetical protein
VHRLSRHTEATFDLRTHSHIFHIPSEGVPKVKIQLMPAVVTDLLTEKTRTDAHPDEWLALLNRLF